MLMLMMMLMRRLGIIHSKLVRTIATTHSRVPLLKDMCGENDEYDVAGRSLPFIARAETREAEPDISC
jgi:hypothetical protein